MVRTSLSDLRWRCKACHYRVGEPRAGKKGKLQDRVRLVKFHVFSGNAHASDCGWSITGCGQ